MSFNMYSSDQLNEEGAWKLRHMLIAERVISKFDSVEFLIGSIQFNKLEEVIVCTDTKIITQELELALYEPDKKTIKEYPYTSITGVSKKGFVFAKVILHLVGNTSITLKNSLPIPFAQALIEFLNSKIEQQKHENDNTPIALSQNTAAYKAWESSPQKQPEPAPPLSSAADEIAKYHALKEQGIISEKEFSAKKKELLGL